MILGSSFAYAAETPTLLERGKRIFDASGGCGCHTDYANNGKPMAGGRGIKTPFGTFYGTNITPDPETGIGQWSDNDFIRAMTQGVGPDGQTYAPVFPYTSFSKITKDDLLALKAYLFSLPAVRQENQSHDLFIPFGERLGFSLWQMLFFNPQPFQNDPSQSDLWNRGAYLSEAVAHCGECHTPRGLTGTLNEGMVYAGSVDGPEGELAPNITPDEETGIGEWALSDLADFLKTGFKPNGDDVQGLMGEVIESGYAHLSDEDLEAMATYVMSLPPIVNQVSSEADMDEEEEINEYE